MWTVAYERGTPGVRMHGCPAARQNIGLWLFSLLGDPYRRGTCRARKTAADYGCGSFRTALPAVHKKATNGTVCPVAFSSGLLYNG